MSIKKFTEIIDSSSKNIWRYLNFLKKIAPENRLSSRQSEFTPIEKIGEWLIKREDKSTTGSHKFRALSFQLSCLLERKFKRAVLSSSGNAAITASKILPKNSKLKLFIFLSKKTPPEKLAALDFSKNCVFIISDRPLRMTKYAIKHFGLSDLRPSQDLNAITGFRSLGFEIFEQNSEVENIFSFATSFASIRGIAEALEILVKSGELKQAPRIFAVVSGGQLAGNLSRHRVDKKTVEWTPSRQLNLSSGHRVDNLICQVDVSDKEILASKQKFVSLETSNEGFASLVAVEKVKPMGKSLIVLTGKNWQKNKEINFAQFKIANNFEEVDKIFTQNE